MLELAIPQPLASQRIAYTTTHGTSAGIAILERGKLYNYTSSGLFSRSFTDFY